MFEDWIREVLLYLLLLKIPFLFYFSDLETHQNLTLWRAKIILITYNVHYFLLVVASSVEWFDPNDNTWSHGPPSTQPRKRMSVAALHWKEYVIGGDDGTKVLRSVEMFDQRTGV